MSRRLRALAGIAGPVIFVAAWSLLERNRNGYSPVSDHISRLAAVGSPTRGPMTTALFAFGWAMLFYANGLYDALPDRRVRGLVYANGAATFGIAFAPLDGRLGDGAHGLFAGIAYITLTALPITAANALHDRGEDGAARASTAAGWLTGLALVASVLAPHRAGLWQRIGLTTGHAWIAASAIAVLRRRS